MLELEDEADELMLEADELKLLLMLEDNELDILDNDLEALELIELLLLEAEDMIDEIDADRLD